MKIGIFYGSTTGDTKAIAHDMAAKLNLSTENIYDVAKTNVDALAPYDCLLLGASTWGLGDLQNDWTNFLEEMKQLNLKGKKVALFGTGNSIGNKSTFCDSLAIIHDALVHTGCDRIGIYTPIGYRAKGSALCREGKFLGLALDQDNESEMTPYRMDAWLASIL